MPVTYGDGLADRLRAAAPDGIDAFIDLFGPQYLDLAGRARGRAQRINTIVSRDRAQELGTKVEGSGSASTVEVLAEMVGRRFGQIKVPIAATYPLERVRDAFAEIEERPRAARSS